MHVSDETSTTIKFILKVISCLLILQKFWNELFIFCKLYFNLSFVAFVRV